MDLITALLAVGTTYLAYINFIILGGIRRVEPSALSKHHLVARTIMFCAYIAATGLFAGSALLSSTGLPVIGALAMVVAGLTSTVFWLVRPRRSRRSLESLASGSQMDTHPRISRH